MDLTDVRRLFSQKEWANARILDAAAALSPEQAAREPGGSLRSIRDTLARPEAPRPRPTFWCPTSSKGLSVDVNVEVDQEVVC